MPISFWNCMVTSLGRVSNLFLFLLDRAGGVIFGSQQHLMAYCNGAQPHIKT